MRNTITHLATEPKIAAVTATTTTASGIATWNELIPIDVGLVGAIAGALLSIVLIITHVLKNKRDAEKHKLELEILKQRLNEKRKRKGKLTRRDD